MSHPVLARRRLAGALACLALALPGSAWAEPEPAPPPAQPPAQGPAQAQPPSPAPEAVVVTGPGRALKRGARDETAASSVVEGEALRRPGQSVAEALRWQPGVQVAASGSGFDTATALVRGASSAQLPVYLAGIRVNDDVSGSADLSTLPSWMVQRVEVYRGNAPIDADRLGIGGAVFVEPRLPRGPELSLATGAGSYGFRSLRLLGGSGDEQAATLVAVSHERADNDYPYTDDRGSRFDTSDDRTLARPNADARQTSGWVVSRVRQGKTQWTAVASVFDREQGAPGLLLSPALSSRAQLRRELGAVRGVIPCGTSCELSLSSTALVSGTRLSDPRGELSIGASRLSVDAKRFEPQARLRFSAAEGVRLSLAADATAERLDRASSGGLREGVGRRTGRAAVQAEVEPSERLLLSALASAERALTRSDGGTDAEASPLSARASARFGDPGAALVANVGRYARVPTLGELYGVSPTVRGNPELLPEAGLGGDVGARFSRRIGGGGGSDGGESGQLVELDAFAFGRTVSDLVAYRRASLQAIRPYNVGEARVLGLEAQGAVTLGPRLRLEQSLSLLDARDVTPGRATSAEQLPFRARLTSWTRASFRLGKLGPLEAVGLGAQLTYEASRYADDAGLVVIPAQGSLDADAQATLPLERGVSLTGRLRGSNLTSAERFDVVGYPLPPRQLFVELELRMVPH